MTFSKVMLLSSLGGFDVGGVAQDGAVLLLVELELGDGSAEDFDLAGSQFLRPSGPEASDKARPI
jgi:hypothetical protein